MVREELNSEDGASPAVSVIVPLHRLTVPAARCLEEVLRLPGGRHELIVVTDRPIDGLPPGARHLTTGAARDTSPAEKRDVAIPHARGAVCAFLDDDAYPAADWLDRALARFEDRTIAAIGGPGITPPAAPLRERVGGAFYESRLGSGGLRYRFVADGPVRDVDDYPAYNFLARTDVLRSIDGWGSRFYGGEDTVVCLKLVEAGHRIVYDPGVVVFHHRRPIFRAHMKQVSNVGRHRGYFVRAYPKTSARPLYFAPSAGLLAAGGATAWAARRPHRLAGLAGLAMSAAAATTLAARREGHDLPVATLLPAALAAGHAAYGAGFLRGLLTRRIDEM